MKKDYAKLIVNDNSLLDEALEYYENEYIAAQSEVKIEGNLIKNEAMLSGLYESRFAQLQELEFISNYFENKLKKIKSFHYKEFLTNYQRALSASDIKIYIEGLDDVSLIQEMINKIILVKNKFYGISKAYESKQWQLNNITKLYSVGMDAVII